MQESLSPQNQQISPWAPEYKQAQLQQSAETIDDGVQIANMHEFDVMEDAVLTGRVYNGEPGWTRGAVGTSATNGAEMWRLDKSERQDDGSYVTHSKWASAEDVQAQTKEYREGLARRAVVAEEAGALSVSATVAREISVSRTSEQLQSTRPEFSISDVSFGLNGFTPDGKMVFTTRDGNGAERDVIVYESKSGGGYRVAQGMEYYTAGDGTKRQRLMKGQELSDSHQYTQDTQLHPDFEEKVLHIEDRIKELKTTLPEQTIIPQETVKDADQLAREFEGSVHVFPLGSERLDALLHKVSPGHLSVAGVEQGLDVLNGAPQHETERALADYIMQINSELETSGVVPDFTQQPYAVAIDEHPQFGQVRLETFRHNANGTTYEWQMAHDNQGRAWVQRLRFANASPSAYGTDKELVYSGLLTSKPADYKQQVTAIPSSQRRDIGSRSYEDITPFLAQFSPIAQYKAQIEQRSQAVR